MEKLFGWKQHMDWFGRTLETEDAIYFNWTDSGFRFGYDGMCLFVQLAASGAIEEEPAKNRKSKVWPVIGIFYDDAEEPAQILEVKGDMLVSLFASLTSEYHIITVRKLTENAKGKLGCKGFLGDGRITTAPSVDCRLRMEFIGDSITCGYGNMSDERDRGFYSDEENGWYSHAAIAGRLLQADYSLISVSGITLMEGRPEWNYPVHGMETIYPYTDYLFEDSLGRHDKTRWDFLLHPKDVVVVNLGTNDANVMDLCDGFEQGISYFECACERFLKTLRESYGADTWLIYALGPMDYFLYDNVLEAVNHYRKETDDQKILTFKYTKLRIEEGFGAAGHPSLDAQKRMGMELANFIKDNCLIKKCNI